MKKIVILIVATLCMLGFAQNDPVVDLNQEEVAAGTIGSFLDSEFAAEYTCLADEAADATEASDDEVEDTTEDPEETDTDTESEGAGSLSENDTFACLLAAVNAAGLTETLMDEEGSFTVFAPTDAAFRDFFEDNADYPTVEALLEDTETLTAVLNYHVSPEGRSLNDFYSGLAGSTEDMVGVPTVAGSEFMLMFPENIDETDEEVTVSISSDGLESSEAAAFIAGNTVALDNGYIIPIDQVLVPPMDGM